MTGALLALVGQRVEAAPIEIGLFTYDVDPDFGRFFQVINTSNCGALSQDPQGAPCGPGLNGTFTDVTLSLFTDTTEFDVHYDAPVTAGTGAAIFENIFGDSGLLNSFPTDAYTRAELTLNFSVAGVLEAILPLDGLTFSGDFGTFSGDSQVAQIFFTPAETPVPEPGTLLLLATGLGSAALSRRRRGR